MTSRICPLCGFSYLISDKDIPSSLVRYYYQDHLNMGCKPTVEFVVGKFLNETSKFLYEIQKDFIV